MNVFAEEKKLIVVSKAKGYLLTALVDQLSQSDYAVETADSMSAIEKITDGIIGFFLFLEENFIADTQLQVYINDRATEDSVPIFVMGNSLEIQDVRNTIPAHLIQKEFVRPINVKDVAANIEKYFEEHDVEQQKTILAVDDSSVMLNSIKNWLSDKYQVLLADSGVAAIKIVTLKRPDLIILDYEMPIVDGAQTLAMIRSEKDFADIPVIFLTGRQDKEGIMEVMKYKPAGYLLKTMRPYDVHKYIDEFFMKKEIQEKSRVH